MNDLVLKGGRVVDPSQGLDKVTDIAFAGGKVAAIGDNLAGKDTRDVAGKIVSPGLIDLHTHVYWGGTSLGVEAELLARTGGVTTFIDAGSAGPRQLPRLPQARDRAVAGPHPALPQRLLPRHLRLLQDRDGRRERRHAPDRSARGRPGGARAQGPGAGHQGARRPLGQRRFRREAARHRPRGRRGARPAGDGPSRQPAAVAPRGRRPAAAGRHPHPLLPPLPQRAGAAPTARCARRSWPPARAA